MVFARRANHLFPSFRRVFLGSVACMRQAAENTPHDLPPQIVKQKVISNVTNKSTKNARISR
jgi:hypothetical protein